MATKEFGGKTINVNDEGYLTDSSEWTKEVAAGIAAEEGISELTDVHYQVLEFMREKAAKGETLTIRAVGKSGITDIKGFYQLFPGAPLKKASKISGIAKPASCV